MITYDRFALARDFQSASIFHEITTPYRVSCKKNLMAFLIGLKYEIMNPIMMVTKNHM